MKLIANNIQIEVEDSGGDGPVVLLIMGLGMQLIAWPPAFVQALVDAGYRVVRHDNRDIGLSQGFDEAGTGSLLWEALRQRIGLQVRSPYTVQDMANDSLGVLDALGIGRAHVIGASMGGMIAQRLAANAPQRAASLVSIMSSSGARGLPGPRRDVAAALTRRPPGRTEAALLAHSMGLVRLIASPAYPHDEQMLAERITRGLRRAYRPAGVVRQMLAIGADTQRPDLLARIACPTLVLHGDADPLVPIACGRDTARRIPGAQFVAVPGMGHDLPPGAVAVLMRHIVPFLAAAEPQKRQQRMTLDNQPEQSQLGRSSAYPDRYDPTQLFPIARATQRAAMGIDEARLPFFGADLWTAFELSWLNARGKPQLAIGHFTVPCETANIIESKSLKLYLGSFNATVFANADAVRERIRVDLAEALWRGSERSGSIGVKLIAPDQFDREPVHELDGVDLDRLDLECSHYQPAPELLSSNTAEAPVTETLASRLLKSNCLVTGQPDWGSVQIRYSGPQIDQAGLLGYIVSFRDHNEFHEPCVERMFVDIQQRCRPTRLAVYARYTRRGGLDINPFRTSWPQALPANVRTARQ